MKFPNYPAQFRAYLANKLKNLSEEKDLSTKVEQLNLWANSHPKHTAAITFSALCLCVVMAFGLSFLSQRSEQASLFSDIEDLSPILQGKQRIEEIKQQQANDVKSFILQGQILKQELDSLMALPLKTHSDSIEIQRKHKQLEIIVRHLNEKD